MKMFQGISKYVVHGNLHLPSAWDRARPKAGLCRGVEELSATPTASSQLAGYHFTETNTPLTYKRMSDLVISRVFDLQQGLSTLRCLDRVFPLSLWHAMWL
jgi:hypothetical protein